MFGRLKLRQLPWNCPVKTRKLMTFSSANIESTSHEMSILLLDISIAMNIAGLAVMSGLESWRPGYVSGAVNISLVWLAAVILVSGGLVVKRGMAELGKEKKSSP